MNSLPDDDLEPLEPPEAFIDISPEVIADGRAVCVVPCITPALSPTLDVIGFPGSGWMIRVKDGFGTVVFSVLLKGIEREAP
jgi:hypothetical protein